VSIRRYRISRPLATLRQIAVSAMPQTIATRPEVPVEDRWLSVDEIATYLGIKRDTVYKWITDKRMPAHKVGRLWKFRKEEINDWVRSGGAENGRPELREEPSN
jgi:excisionase family DNA binding protein